MMTKIICDFDGTTAVNDVGNLLFRTFADERCHDIVRQWKDGKINSRECLEQECDISRVSRAELTQFADSQALDPAFAEFVQICAEHRIQVEIASDGLDFYIERILAKYQLQSSVAAKANSLKFIGDSRIAATFPYFELGCGQCGNCKGYHVKEAQKTFDRVIYVGDGLSDRCGAQAANVVFAKKGRDLIQYCIAHDIAHHQYDDFADILNQSEIWLNG